jgi:hypothetical protein
MHPPSARGKGNPQHGWRVRLLATLDAASGSTASPKNAACRCQICGCNASRRCRFLNLQFTSGEVSASVSGTRAPGRDINPSRQWLSP